MPMYVCRIAFNPRLLEGNSTTHMLGFFLFWRHWPSIFRKPLWRLYNIIYVYIYKILYLYIIYIILYIYYYIIYIFIILYKLYIYMLLTILLGDWDQFVYCTWLHIALKIAWQCCDSVILPISIARREVVEGCIERLCKLCWAEAIEERIHRMHRCGPLSETRFFFPIYSTINSDLKRLYAVYIICHSKMLRLLPSASGQTASPRLMWNTKFPRV